MRYRVLLPLALSLLPACAFCPHGGGAGLAELTIFALSQPSDGEPRYFIDGADVDIQVWTNGAQLDQVLVRSATNDIQTRVLFDLVDGDPKALIDEKTGGYVVLVSNGPSRMDFLSYDSSDAYVEGFTIFQSGSTFHRARILGIPAFTGQIQGQLSPGSSGSGSFAVVADETDALDGLVDVTDQMNALIAAMGGTSDGAYPLVSLSRVLKVGGIVLIAGAPVLAPAYVAAGVAMVMGGFFTNDVANFIESGFATEDPFAQSLVDLAVSLLRDTSHPGLFELLDGIVVAAKDVAAGVFTPSEDEPVAVETVDSYPEEPAPILPAEDAPTPDGGPPTIPVTVTGQAVWQDGTTEPVSGTIDGDGNLTLEGPDGTLTIDGAIDSADSTVSGTYDRDSEQGTMDGVISAVGSCETTQQSGGQGTFTSAHYVGEGSGSVTFTYDAYSIPDAFSASVGGIEQFTTNGLVSGMGSATLTVAGERFVLVSVSAPDASTAWDYSLSCM